MRFLGDDNDPIPGEDIQDPEAGPDPGYDTIWPEEELTYISPTTGSLITTGGVALSLAESLAFLLLCRRLKPTSWPWYLLGGLIGFRLIGAIMSVSSSSTDTPNV